MPEQARILIVDDVPQNIRLVAALLSPDGYEISIAVSSENALEQIEANDFDLILLDIMMPDIDGIQLCQMIKAMPAKKDAQIIFLTAKDDEAHLLRAFEAGAVDYLCKPFNPSELAIRVKTHLELKASRDLIARTNVQLQEALDVKNRFLSMAAHEINNPLAVSVGYLDLLEEHPAVAKDKILSENVAKIKRAHARVQERLDEFLSKAALELGRIELKPRRLNLLKLVEEAVQSCSSLAEAKQQQLLLQASAASIWLKADYHRLFEVVENLLSNAIKYSAPGQSIEIRVEEAAAGVRFSVQDQGPGFTPSDKEKAFAYFQRLSARPTGGEASVGVGLAVSKQIVELHQGRIWLESEVGQGTTFIVELPA